MYAVTIVATDSNEVTDVSLPIMIVATLLVLALVVLAAGVRNAIAIRRDFNQRFDRLRTGLETDATHLLGTLLRGRRSQGSSGKPGRPPLRRVK
jgi:hypothetical protein